MRQASFRPDAPSTRERQRRGRALVSRLACAFVIALVAGLSAGSEAVAASIRLDVDGRGSQVDLLPGANVEIDVFAEGVGTAGGGLFGFGFTLSLDGLGAVLGVPVVDTAVWTGLIATSSEAGRVAASGNVAGQPSGLFDDPLLLARITLTVSDTPGSFALDLGPLTGVGDNLTFDGAFLDGDPSFFVDGAIRVVPEPSVGVLILVAALLAQTTSRRTTRSR